MIVNNFYRQIWNICYVNKWLMFKMNHQMLDGGRFGKDQKPFDTWFVFISLGPFILSRTMACCSIFEHLVENIWRLIQQLQVSIFRQIKLKSYFSKETSKYLIEIRHDNVSRLYQYKTSLTFYNSWYISHSFPLKNSYDLIIVFVSNWND